MQLIPVLYRMENTTQKRLLFTQSRHIHFLHPLSYTYSCEFKIELFSTTMEVTFCPAGKKTNGVIEACKI